MTLDAALVYDYGVMDTAITDINGAETQLHQIEADIKSDLAKLGQTWTEGTDHARYVQYQQAWDKVFEDVKAALTGLRMVATGCLDNAKENESRCASMWPDV